MVYRSSSEQLIKEIKETQHAHGSADIGSKKEVISYVIAEVLIDGI